MTATATKTKAILYTKPNCSGCFSTKLKLNKAGLVADEDYEIRDISKDPAYIDEIKALGYQQLPVMVVGEEHWSDFRPDLIDAFLSKEQ